MTQPKLVSASELSRKIQTPISRILRAVHGSAIVPDAVIMNGKVMLFSESRAQEIAARLDALDHRCDELAVA